MVGVRPPTLARLIKKKYIKKEIAFSSSQCTKGETHKSMLGIWETWLKCFNLNIKLMSFLCEHINTD